MTIREQLADRVFEDTAPSPRVRIQPVPVRAPADLDAAPVGDWDAQRRHAIRQRLLKRSLDLFVALPMFALLLVPMTAIAILVRLDSPGPALFRQRRLGRAGKPFDIVKFRTMHVQENGDDVVQARPNDRRITRVGRWLRRSSLDELPQLYNVIRGEMSLVGPRPHAVLHDRQFAALIGDYGLRQMVKPGITGWAQIHGLRGPTPNVETMRMRVSFDIWYARHANFRLDLRILLQTPLELFRRRNAF